MKAFSPTHKGLMYGIVPVFLDMRHEDMPGVAGRNAACELLLDICEGLFGICVFLRSCVDRDYEPVYPVMVTGEL